MKVKQRSTHPLCMARGSSCWSRGTSTLRDTRYSSTAPTCRCTCQLGSPGARQNRSGSRTQRDTGSPECSRSESGCNFPRYTRNYGKESNVSVFGIIAGCFR